MTEHGSYWVCISEGPQIARGLNEMDLLSSFLAALPCFMGVGRDPHAEESLTLPTSPISVFFLQKKKFVRKKFKCRRGTILRKDLETSSLTAGIS